MSERTKKIQLLKGLLNGTRKVDELLPPLPMMFFIERSENPGVYVCDGKTYSKKEVEKFRNKTLIWVERKTY